MPKVEISRSHEFTMEKAKEKVDILANDLKDKYKLTTSWSGYCLDFKRTGAKGKIQLEDKKVIVTVDLSMLLSALKSKVEERINQKLDEEFS